MQTRSDLLRYTTMQRILNSIINLAHCIKKTYMLPQPEKNVFLMNNRNLSQTNPARLHPACNVPTKNEKAFALYVSIVLGQVSGVDTASFSDALLDPSFEPRSVF